MSGSLMRGVALAVITLLVLTACVPFPFAGPAPVAPSYPYGSGGGMMGGGGGMMGGGGIPSPSTGEGQGEGEVRAPGVTAAGADTFYGYIRCTP